MGFVQTAAGMLILLVSLTGAAFGLFMSTHPSTRTPGVLFALLWVPGAVVGGGVLMRDLATFAVGSVCFLVAMVFVLLGNRRTRRPAIKHRTRLRQAPRHPRRGAIGRDGSRAHRTTAP